MHIYIGGAHNGKRQFVREQLSQEEVEWFEGELPKLNQIVDDKKIVIAGLENWLAKTDLNEEQAITHIIKRIQHRNCIIILTDIGRGIVPMDAQQRRLRDVCGRLNQQLIVQAEEVTRVWYGIPQTLKKRGEGQ